MRLFLNVHRYLSASRIPIFAGGLTVAVLLIITVLEAGVRNSGTNGIVSLQLAFTQARFTEIVAGWNPDLLRTYKLALIWDYAFPFLYVPFLAGFIARAFPLSDPENPRFLPMALFALPFDAGLLDWVENSLHVVLLNGVPPYSDTLVLLASLAALVKWTYIVIALSAVVFAGISGKIKSGL